MNAQETDVKLTLFSEYRNSSSELVEIVLTKTKRMQDRPLLQESAL